MSIASDYANFEDKVVLWNVEFGFKTAEVTSDGQFRYCAKEEMLSPDEALALAKWINDTFTDIPQEKSR